MHYENMVPGVFLKRPNRFIAHVLLDGKTETVSTVVGTAVYFNELSQEWIRSYVAGGSPMDKAGAYGIQDGGLVKKIKGSYSNVVGLPVEKLQKTLKKMQKKGFGL